jgi:hypothetical protein
MNCEHPVPGGRQKEYRKYEKLRLVKFRDVS